MPLKHLAYSLTKKYGKRLDYTVVVYKELCILNVTAIDKSLMGKRIRVPVGSELADITFRPYAMYISSDFMVLAHGSCVVKSTYSQKLVNTLKAVCSTVSGGE